jgi:hypothetical protein
MNEEPIDEEHDPGGDRSDNKTCVVHAHSF